jgi:MerR family transcriptional regulator, light-induced transcriptional regulator
MEPGSGAVWTAGQVARHLGIAESTLRSWHRRYGIGPHGREPGRYRRYTEADVARLQHMLDLINLGMLASDAARAVEAGESEAVPPEQDVLDLVTAARAADSVRCGIVLDYVIARRGVVDAWEEVCRPALVIVDADQRDDPDCMDIEHALSWSMLAALNRAPRPPIAPGAGLVLLACIEAEHHTLPLAALSSALASHRVPVRMLGAATPTQSLVRAVRDTLPSAVVLWSQRPEVASYQVLRALLPFPVRVLTAGPGWPEAGLEGIEHVTSLRHALTALHSTPSNPDRPDDPDGPTDSPSSLQ